MIQSFIDEIAHELQKDPLEFRLELLGQEEKLMPYEHHDSGSYSTARLRNVLVEAAEMAKWQEVPPPGTYRGIACHFIFGSYVALVCELSIVDDKPKVQKFFAAVDCGLVINPSGAKSTN